MASACTFICTSRPTCCEASPGARRLTSGVRSHAINIATIGVQASVQVV